MRVRTSPPGSTFSCLPLSAHVLMRATLNKTSNINTVNKRASLWYDNVPSSFCCYANGVDCISNHFQAFSEEKDKRRWKGSGGGGLVEGFWWGAPSKAPNKTKRGLGILSIARAVCSITLTLYQPDWRRGLRSRYWALGRFRPGRPVENLCGVMGWRLQDVNAFSTLKYALCLTDMDLSGSDLMVVLLLGLNISIHIDFDYIRRSCWMLLLLKIRTWKMSR